MDISLTQLYESPLNPRQRRNEKADAELAASIKADGIIQPLVVRPDNNGKYEIICGSRRFRAAQAIGLDKAPVVEREATDEQISRIALIENLQRESLHAIEEAEGFALLMKQMTADQLAEHVGKSRSYIFGRLKLLSLNEEAKRLFFAGAFPASIALLISRVPSALQGRVIDEATRKDYNNDQPSFRAVQRMIQNRFMLKLADAPFPIEDANLVATAESCAQCPKRTINDPDLFEDLEGHDLCTDIDCYTSKKSAHAARLIEQAGTKAKVASKEESEKIWPDFYGRPKDHYVQPNEVCYDDPAHRTYGQIMGDQSEASILVQRQGTVAEVIPKRAVNEKLKAMGIETEDSKSKEKRKKVLANIRLHQKWRESMFQDVRKVCDERAAKSGKTAIGAANLFIDLAPVIAERMWSMLPRNLGEKAATLWGAIGSDDHGRYQAFTLGIPTFSDTQLVLFLIDMALIGQSMCDEYDYRTDPNALKLACQRLNIDAEAILKREKESQKEAERAKSAKKKPKNITPCAYAEGSNPITAAQAEGQSGAKNEADAATAAQAGDESANAKTDAAPGDSLSSAPDGAGNETPNGADTTFAVGQVVRVIDNRNSTLIGKEGRIDRWIGGEVFRVKINGIGALAFKTCELELLEGQESCASDEANETPSAQSADGANVTAESSPQSSQAKRQRETCPYQHPEIPDLQWSGRGQKPKWVQDWIAQGNSLESLERKGKA